MRPNAATLVAGRWGKKAEVKRSGLANLLQNQSSRNSRRSDPLPQPPRQPPAARGRRSDPGPGPAAAVKAATASGSRPAAAHFIYDEFPTDQRMDRASFRNYRGGGVAEDAKAARSAMGHAYIDAGLVADGIAKLTQNPCPGSRRRCGVMANGHTSRGVGGGALNFACAFCFEQRPLPTSRRLSADTRTHETTVRAVHALSGEGLGHAKADRILMNMDLLPVNNAVWEQAAQKARDATDAEFAAMIDANISEEAKLTLLVEGESCLSPSGKIMIRVMTDGTWQKRYGRNSLWGAAALYGYYTGGCVFASSRCARCATCMRAAQGKADAPAHKCTRTWNEAPNRDGTTSLMEKDIVLEGVNYVYAKGVVVGCLITDGDTKALSEVQKRGPEEVRGLIEGMLDLGHWAKNLGKKLKELNESTEFRGMLPMKQQNLLRSQFSSLVYSHRNKHEDEEHEGQAEVLQAALRNAPRHLFSTDDDGKPNEHAGCGSWCKLKKANTEIFDQSHIPKNMKSFLDTRVRARVIAIFEQYSSLADCKRLLLRCSTNTCGSANSLLWLRYLPKTNLRPKQGGGKWKQEQLTKQKRPVAASAAVQTRMGLAPLAPGVAAAAANRDVRVTK